jgi:hypothetical protein
VPVRQHRHEQQILNGSPRAGEPFTRSLAPTDRAHSDLAGRARGTRRSLPRGERLHHPRACRAKSFATTIEARTVHDGSLGRSYCDQCRIAAKNLSRAPKPLGAAAKGDVP